jgi:hypothetical protein
VRVTSSQPPRHRDFSRTSARGWTRTARCWLILFACLAQSLVFAQHRHAPGFASHSIVTAAKSGPHRASDGLEQTAVRCALDIGHADSSDHGAPPPCQEDNCPCCPPVHAAAGILPPETAYTAYAPLLSKTVAPLPALLGCRTRPVTFDGQPRAPPILI